MGRKLNLGELTEEECEQILKVIQRDFDLRQKEKERIASVQAEVEGEKARADLLAKHQPFNENCCLACFSKFIFLLNSKVQCSECQFYFCKKCTEYEANKKTNICFSCKKQWELEVQSNSWFYKNVSSKFKRFGSAKVVRSLYKRKSNTDSEYDSGCQGQSDSPSSESFGKQQRQSLSRVFEKDDEKTKGFLDTLPLSSYKKRLDNVAQKMREIYLDQNAGNGGTKNGGKYNELIGKQRQAVKDLLTSMFQDITSQLPNGDSQYLSKCILRECLPLLYPTENDKDRPPFSIDSDDLNLHDYVDRVSDAIIRKIDGDLRVSGDAIFLEEEEAVKNEFLKLSNKARISQLGGLLSDGSEMEELQVTTDDDHQDQDTFSFDRKISDSQYNVDEQSILSIASRKRNQHFLPDFGESDLKSVNSDSDLDVTLSRESDQSDVPWMLSEKGPMFLSKRVPFSPRGNYGEKTTNTAIDDDRLIFLPNNPQNEGTIIAEEDPHDLSDLSEDEENFHVAPKDDVDHVESSLKAELESVSPTNNQLKLSKKISLKDINDNPVNAAAPEFISNPQDVRVVCGDTLLSECKLCGIQPIDVFWYRDEDDNLVQLEPSDRIISSHQGDIHSLSMDNMNLSDQGYYVCIAVNEHGYTQHGFEVTVVCSADELKTDLSKEVSSIVNQFNDENDCSTEGRGTLNRPESSFELEKLYPILEASSFWPENSTNDTVSKDNADGTERTRTDLDQERRHEKQPPSSVHKIDDRIATETRNAYGAPDQSIPEGVFPEKSDSNLTTNYSMHSGDPKQESNENENQDIFVEEKFRDSGDLNLTFEEFEKLYEAQIITRSRIKSGKFSPGEIEKIKNFLSNTAEETKQIECFATAEMVPLVVDCGIPQNIPMQYQKDFIVGTDDSSESSRNTLPKMGKYTRSNIQTSKSNSFDESSEQSTANDFEKMVMPSVKDLMMKFSASQDADESSFKRNYSLTARTVPKYVTDQQQKNSLSSVNRNVRISNSNAPSDDWKARSSQSLDFPTAYVPLYPTPINSKRFPESTDRTFPGAGSKREETKFSNEILVRTTDEVDDQDNKYGKVNENKCVSRSFLKPRQPSQSYSRSGSSAAVIRRQSEDSS